MKNKMKNKTIKRNSLIDLSLDARREVLFVGAGHHTHIIQPGFTENHLNPVYNAYAGVFKAHGAFGLTNDQ